MTKEDAAKILEYPVYKWSLDWDDREDGLGYGEAIKIAIYALRAQQAKLDRSRWEARPITKQRPYRSEKFKEVKLSEDGEVLYRKVVTIHEDWTDDYCSACGKKLCSRFTSYCPNCGRPLTEKAWTELERRINDGTAD